MTKPPPRHWLARAIDAWRPGASKPMRLPADRPIAELWAEAAAGLGIDEQELARHVASFCDLQVASLDAPQEAALRLLPAVWVSKNMVLPLHQDDTRIVVAVSDPRDLRLEEDLRFTAAREPIFVVAGPVQLGDAIAANYGDHGG